VNLSEKAAVIHGGGTPVKIKDLPFQDILKSTIILLEKSVEEGNKKARAEARAFYNNRS